jgi:1-acyl-sn-glycerol-3-phosphate acyltransferase
MKKTIFNTPYVTPAIRAVFIFIFQISGWTAVGKRPSHPKYVAAVAPHTSLLDAFVVIATCFALGIEAKWWAKKQWFKYATVARVMEWMGAIPVNRETPKGEIDAIVKAFKESKTFVFGLAPQGSRSNAGEWKKGFCRIARDANVPIVLVVINGTKKQCGVIGEFTPTDDMESDIKNAKNMFDGVSGIKH